MDRSARVTGPEGIEMNILCDADGVLTDFFSAALDAHGMLHLAADWPPGEWDMPMVMGLTQEQFWRPLDNYEFWRNKIKMCHGAHEFFAELKKLGPVTICTAPSEDPMSIAGKINMLRAELGKDIAVMAGSRKYLMAKHGNVLVDDNDANCDLFAASGGEYVMVPRPWNRLHGPTGPQVYWDVLTLVKGFVR